MLINDNKLPSNMIGERIFLREMLEEDTPDIVRWRNDPEIKRWMISQDIITVESHLKWFRSRTKNRFDYMICDINTKKCIGTVNYKMVTPKIAESGRILGEKQYWGKGYASEAARIWLKYGFQYLQLEKIIAKTKIDNSANVNLNNKLGFDKVKEQEIETVDGTIRLAIMELKSEEYEIKK